MRDAGMDQDVNQAMTPEILGRETSRPTGTGGVSAGNRGEGFWPAFLDTASGRIYLSRYGDGRLAPFHLLDGLPDDLVLARSASGRVQAVKVTMVSGFVRAGRFYSRDEAAQAVAGMH